MSTRGRTTFQKRQKELARMEKQREKMARRAQRKLEKQMGVATEDQEQPDTELEPGAEAPAEEPAGEP